MLNIPLFLIRQQQFGFRCNDSESAENCSEYNHISINQLQFAIIPYLKNKWGIDVKTPHSWFSTSKQSL
jgi:hypothetical protein